MLRSRDIPGRDPIEPGRIGIVSRSPALANEVGHQLEAYGLGASKIVDLPAQGASHLELLKLFERHWGTDAVLLLGAIDAGEEGACTEWIARHMDKPVIGWVDQADAAQEARLRACGVHVSRDAASIGALAASVVECPWLPFD